MNKILIVLMTLSAFNLSAKEGGNGGDAIVCKDKVVLLDYIEMGSEMKDLTLDLPGNTLEKKVQIVVSRVKQIDNYRSKLIYKYAQELLIDIKSRVPNKRYYVFTEFTEKQLLDVSDSLNTTIPTGCEKVQLVVQKPPVFGFERFLHNTCSHLG